MVLDTSVLVDFALETADRHSDAVLVVKSLIERRLRIRAPYHAMFEFAATIRRCIRLEGARHAPHAANDDSSTDLLVHAVPINREFVDHYSLADLPHLKGGDLIFLALARGDAAVLITEDTKLLERATQVGVRCFNMMGYLESRLLEEGAP